MTAFVLLPGLDGTGRLMHGFVVALGSDAEVQIVSYPTDRVLGYADLVAFVRNRLPRHHPYILVAESFSGPVGWALAASRPRGLVGLVLCASFVSTPFPALRRLSFLLRLAPVRTLPAAALAVLLLGRWSSAERVGAIRAVLQSVSPAVLRARAQAALSCVRVESLDRVEVPVLYLRATEDRLVPRSASQHLQQAIPSVTVTTIEGPHFLLQAVPSACAAAIHSFMRSVAPES